MLYYRALLYVCVVVMRGGRSFGCTPRKAPYLLHSPVPVYSIYRPTLAAAVVTFHLLAACQQGFVFGLFVMLGLLCVVHVYGLPRMCGDPMFDVGYHPGCLLNARCLGSSLLALRGCCQQWLVMLWGCYVALLWRLRENESHRAISD